MGKKKWFGIFGILALLLISTLLLGCLQSNDAGNVPQDQISTGLEQYNEPDNTPGPSDNLAASDDIEKVEVIHFHRTNQCYSCITVGDYAEETVNTYFAEELMSGKITFAHLNTEQPENFDIAEKYGVTGASLWLGVYKKGGGFSKEQDTAVWYKINNKPEYMNYLKGVIENKFEGN